MATNGGGPTAPISRGRLRAYSVAALCVFLLLWELLPRYVFWGSWAFAMRPLSQVLAAAWGLITDWSLLEDTGYSTSRVLVGFLAASVVAIPAGIAMGTSVTIKAVLSPYLAIVRPLPSVAWIPIVLVTMGIDESSKWAIIFMGALAPILVATIEATVSVDDNMLRAARNLGANRMQVMFRVLLPAALPQILAGWKVAFAVAWTCIISAEFIATERGLGARMFVAKDWGGFAQVPVYMASIVLTVTLLDVLLNRVIKRLLPWQDV